MITYLLVRFLGQQNDQTGREQTEPVIPQSLKTCIFQKFSHLSDVFNYACSLDSMGSLKL